MAKYNVASRLYEMMKRAEAIQSGVVVDGWAQVLAIDEPDAHERDQQVARGVGLLRDELATLRSELAQQGVDEGTYSAALGRVSHALSIRALSGQWSQVRQHLAPQTLAVLRILPELLPSPEQAIDGDALKGFADELADLRKRVQTGSLPIAVKAFLLRQVELMLRAVREYPIRGAAAFREASLESGVLWQTDGAVVESYADAPEVTEVRGLWSKARRFAEGVALIHAFWTAGVAAKTTALEWYNDAKRLPPAAQVHHETAMLPAPRQGDEADESEDTAGGKQCVD